MNRSAAVEHAVVSADGSNILLIFSKSTERTYLGIGHVNQFVSKQATFPRFLQSWRSRQLRIPAEEITIAITLCLGDMKDFILNDCIRLLAFRLEKK